MLETLAFGQAKLARTKDVSVVVEGTKPDQANFCEGCSSRIMHIEGHPFEVKQGELLVLKRKKEWNEEDRMSIQLNAKAMHALFYALCPEEYNNVLSCSIAKEIWKKLEVTHECTTQVKKSKIGIITINYETFKMKLKEDIKVMFDRFTIIISGLNHMIRFIPMKKWGRRRKVEKKKVAIALKSTTIEENDSSDDVDEDKEMTMFARRFKRFMKSNKGRRSQKNKGLKLASTKKEILSFAMSAKSWDTSNSIVPSGRRMDQTNKRSRLILLLGVTKILSMMNNMKAKNEKKRHMTGDKSHFIGLKPKSGGEVTFGDNSKGLIESIGSIGKNSSVFIENVFNPHYPSQQGFNKFALKFRDFKAIFEIIKVEVWWSVIDNLKGIKGFPSGKTNPLLTIIHTPLSFGALHHPNYKKDPLTRNWVKGVQPELHEVDDKEVRGEKNDVPPAS
ncbi:hypothetical protein J1N35_041383 [Gossypium stocksii]|uniref:Uncharacterized protein n=1 Tax=Gossypium stocksii TaxID=47602 RepID=A0A9D3ZIL8_9ROSI|nr:hypothetical protein J1N35_041383 [Gossypium stocksii]